MTISTCGGGQPPADILDATVEAVDAATVDPVDPGVEVTVESLVVESSEEIEEIPDLPPLAPVRWRRLENQRVQVPLAVSGESVIVVSTGWGDGLPLYVDYPKLVAAIEPDGHVAWQGFFSGIFPRTPVVDDSGNVLLVQGELAWQIPPRPDYLFNVIVQKFKPGGEIEWTTDIPEGPITRDRFYCSPALDEAGNLYFGAGTKLYSIDRDGNVRWAQPVSWEGNFAPVNPDWHSPAVTSGGIYVVDSNANLLRFTRDGVLDQTVPLPLGMTHCGPAISPAGQIVVPCSGVTWLGFDGQTLGSAPWSYAAYGPPTIAGDGTTYFIGSAYRDGTLLWQEDVSDFDFGSEGNHPPIVTRTAELVFLLGGYGPRGVYIVGPDGLLRKSFRRPPEWNVGTGFTGLDVLGPVIPAAGLLVYPTNAGGVVALDVPVETADPAAWAYVNGDGANTRRSFPPPR
jgi:outer membrane protein assembly factor BamB